MQQAGGCLTVEDLAAHASTWEQPISATYRGLPIWECPPNGQGLAALLGLNLLEGFDLAALPAAFDASACTWRSKPAPGLCRYALVRGRPGL